MSHTLDVSLFPWAAKNVEDGREILYSNKTYSLVAIASVNDMKVRRSKVVLERKIHGKVPVDVVMLFGLIKIGGKRCIILTRQWREATSKYSIAPTAGGCEEQDENPIKAALRELEEETPFEATEDDFLAISDPSYSSDGCLGETFQAFLVNVKPKDDRVTFENGIVRGTTKQTGGECIMTLYIPLEDLYEGLIMLQKQNHSIDGRLMMWAWGQHVAKMDSGNTLAAKGMAVVLFCWMFSRFV
jgi:8-oxo-dGTP pyrophosphatase MutT (NUDIX family)